jgi:hypothetical protein
MRFAAQFLHSNKIFPCNERDNIKKTGKKQTDGNGKGFSQVA